MAKKPQFEPKRVARLSPEHFLNRELQALEFNRRVLAQAEDKSVPLLERLKFLCIVSSNLDEFFEIRLSGVKEQIKLGAAAAEPDGLSPQRGLPRSRRCAHGIVERQYQLLNERDPPRAREGGHPLPAPLRVEPGAAGVGPRLLLPRDDAGADAHRPRSRASVPARVQQEPELRRRARGPRRLRPRLARRHRAGAARAAARDPPAQGRGAGRQRLHLPHLGAAQARGRALRGHERARAATSSASRATPTSSSRRRR